MDQGSEAMQDPKSETDPTGSTSDLSSKGQGQEEEEDMSEGTPGADDSATADTSEATDNEDADEADGDVFVAGATIEREYSNVEIGSGVSDENSYRGVSQSSSADTLSDLHAGSPGHRPTKGLWLAWSLINIVVHMERCPYLIIILE